MTRWLTFFIGLFVVSAFAVTPESKLFPLSNSCPPPFFCSVFHHVFTTANPSEKAINTGFSGLKYLNPDEGRFWTMDTLEGSNEDSSILHSYLYVANNPANKIDPSGNLGLFEVLGSMTLGLDLRGNRDRQAVQDARRIAASLCSIAAQFARPYNKLYAQITKYTKFDSHHIFQNSVMEDIFDGYERAFGFAIPLLGRSPGSPHSMASDFQRLNKGRSPRFVAYGALRAAGCRNADATAIVLAAENWNAMLGWIP